VTDGDCVFCRIVNGTEPASVVHRDDDVAAFCDIAPFNPGHVLVVPCRHAAHLEDLAEADGARMFEVAHRLARGLRRSGLRCEGVNLFLADGAAAFQEVFHVHLHVIPRWRGDGVQLRARRRTPGREQLDLTAVAVRRGMAQLPTPKSDGRGQ
jgi:histidine triad (HIT) family protein